MRKRRKLEIRAMTVRRIAKWRRLARRNRRWTRGVASDTISRERRNTAEKFVAPQFGKTAFHCPHCGVYADQCWSLFGASGHLGTGLCNVKSFRTYDFDDFAVSCCGHCGEICIWCDEKLIFPKAMVVELPNEDLPEDIKKDYLEAANILQDSPRGATALLRLCIQKLCKELGEKGKNLNDDIRKLVEKGLPADIAKAMDLLRVTGDNAVHPGEIDLNDNPEIAFRLFRLVNFVADEMITKPRQLSTFYDDVMPQNAKDAIARRDGEEKRCRG